MLRALEIHRPNGVSPFFESVRSSLLLTAALLAMGGCTVTRSISSAPTLEHQDGNAKANNCFSIRNLMITIHATSQHSQAAKRQSALSPVPTWQMPPLRRDGQA